MMEKHFIGKKEIMKEWNGMERTDVRSRISK